MKQDESSPQAGQPMPRGRSPARGGAKGRKLL